MKRRDECHMIREIDILGVKYTVSEVDTVNKTTPRKGEIDFLKSEILIDSTMPKTLKEQVLMHEILHAVFDLLGFDELGDDESQVQALATALHQVFTAQNVFSA